MVTTVDAPLQWVESITMLRLPEQADQRLQALMDRNNEGQLSDDERADLAALAELSERLSLVRAEALHLLGRKPAIFHGSSAMMSFPPGSQFA